MSKNSLHMVWCIGFIVISVIIFSSNIAVALMLFVYKLAPENKEAALIMWGGINGITGILIKAWIDNPFDDSVSKNPTEETKITQINN